MQSLDNNNNSSTTSNISRKRRGEKPASKPQTKKVREQMLKTLLYPSYSPSIPASQSITPLNLTEFRDHVFHTPLSKMATLNHKANLPFIIAMVEEKHVEKGGTPEEKSTIKSSIYEGSFFYEWVSTKKYSPKGTWIKPIEAVYFITHSKEDKFLHKIATQTIFGSDLNNALIKHMRIATAGTPNTPAQFDAQYDLAYYYLDNKHLHDSENEAFRYFKNCSKMTHPQIDKEKLEIIFTHLCDCYSKRFGTEKNLEDMLKSYLKLITLKGNLEIKKDDMERIDNLTVEEAFKQFKDLADNNHYWAQYVIGTCYKDGINVPKDINEAYKCFKLSSATEVLAMYHVAYYSWTGTDIEENLLDTYDYIEKAKSEEIDSISLREVLESLPNSDKMMEWYDIVKEIEFEYENEDPDDDTPSKDYIQKLQAAKTQVMSK